MWATMVRPTLKVTADIIKLHAHASSPSDLVLHPLYAHQVEAIVSIGCLQECLVHVWLKLGVSRHDFIKAATKKKIIFNNLL